MDKENAVISHFANKFIGDDAALAGDLIYSKDLFCEDTHFKRSWLNMNQIGQKAVLINISDAIAMNAKPKFALLGLGIPKNLSNTEINELCGGIKQALAKFDCEIIGGDTIKSDKIFVSITIISEPNGKILNRNGAKFGDLICFTGNLGKSLKDLKTLQNGGKIASNSKFTCPQIRSNFIKDAAKFIRSAMDISDGLASDLPKICGKFGFKFNQKLSKFELISGEEYEMLFTISPKNLAKICNLAKKHRLKLNILGKITKRKCKIHGKFTHF